MSDQNQSPPRLSVVITDEQRAGLNRYLGQIHGMQKAVFCVIIDDLLDKLERLEPNEVEMFLGGILARAIKIDDYVNT